MNKICISKKLITIFLFAFLIIGFIYFSQKVRTSIFSTKSRAQDVLTCPKGQILLQPLIPNDHNIVEKDYLKNPYCGSVDQIVIGFNLYNNFNKNTDNDPVKYSNNAYFWNPSRLTIQPVSNIYLSTVVSFRPDSQTKKVCKLIQDGNVFDCDFNNAPKFYERYTAAFHFNLFIENKIIYGSQAIFMTNISNSTDENDCYHDSQDIACKDNKVCVDDKCQSKEVIKSEFIFSQKTPTSEEDYKIKNGVIGISKKGLYFIVKTNLIFALPIDYMSSAYDSVNVFSEETSYRPKATCNDMSAVFAEREINSFYCFIPYSSGIIPVTIKGSFYSFQGKKLVDIPKKTIYLKFID